MQKILRKRLFREFRTNFMRYIALFLLITIGMYIIVSLISVSEAVHVETLSNAQQSKVEDGEFTLMVPLSDADFTALENRGVQIETCFYMDYIVENDNSMIRIFRNRKEINRIHLDEGDLAQKKNEIVIEKVYALNHDLHVGDNFLLSNRSFLITGIGTAVDYDEPLQNNSSIGADSTAFGLGFVSDETYQMLAADGLASKSETYLYSYRLNDSMTDQELKRELLKLKPELAQVENVYIQEMIGSLKSMRGDLESGLKDLNSGIDDLSEGRNELENGTKDITSASNDFRQGTAELADGSKDLKSATEDLVDGSGELLDGSDALNTAAGQFSKGVDAIAAGGEKLGSGITDFANGAKELNSNANEFASEMEKLQSGYDTLAKNNHRVKQMADALLENEIIDEDQCQALYDYVDGVEDLGEGISLASTQARKLQREGTAELSSQVETLNDGIKKMQKALAKLKDGSAQLSAGTAELYANLKILKSGSAELDLGAGDVVEGANEIHGYANEFDDSITELQKGADELSSGVQAFQKGTHTLQSEADELIRDYLNYEIDNMTMFMPNSDNARIGAADLSVSVYKSAGIIIGIILFLLFAYVISVFISHNVEQEGMMIGALYSMGVNKRELMIHYMTLPTILTFLGGITGTIIGFSQVGTRLQLASVEAYYSLPYCQTVYPLYLILYGVLLPPVITLLVNYFVIHSKLSATALSLLRNEKKQNHLGKMNLGKLGFMNRFRIRQFCKEIRSSLAIMIGIFISLILVLLALDVYSLCENSVNAAEEETSYNYMYVYKYPSKIAPEDGETFYVETLRSEAYGEQFDVSVWGMYHNNTYFDVDTTKEMNEIVISEAVSSKFQVDKGDILTLTDTVGGVDYAFEVASIAPYAASMSVYMDMSQMQELFGQSRNYYNVVLSKKALDIDSGRLETVNTKEDVVKAAYVTKNSMSSLINSVVIVGAFVLFVVMYLMMKVAMDRASFQISLLKIFGFRSRDVRKLYLDGNFFVVILTLIIGIPVAKKIVGIQIPYLIASMVCANNTNLSPLIYMGMVFAVLIVYILINWILVRKIQKVTPAEVLKNRE